MWHPKGTTGYGGEVPIDRDAYRPPPSPPRDRTERVRGALGGSLLYAQPEHAAALAELERFVAPEGPLAVEVGFDHGITLLDNARTFPDVRWLGVEIRRRRVEAVRAHAPANCLPLRMDARTLFAALLPAGRVSRVDILFPTPAEDGRHLLLTSAFVEDLARALAPGGIVHLTTDVPALHELARGLFAGWATASEPPRGPALSRRERVCRRDGIPVRALTVSPAAPVG